MPGAALPRKQEDGGAFRPLLTGGWLPQFEVVVPPAFGDDAGQEPLVLRYQSAGGSAVFLGREDWDRRCPKSCVPPGVAGRHRFRVFSRRRQRPIISCYWGW